jgi:hypothetical protein
MFMFAPILAAVFACSLFASAASTSSSESPFNPKVDCAPDERPREMRTLTRCCLIGLNPAAGFVCVDCLVDFDEEPSVVAPTLPPIDPRIIDALQRILKETANPTVPRLIIHLEEQPIGEEQEPVIPTEWSSEPRDAEIPHPAVDPVDDELTPEEDEAQEPEELSKQEWSALLREVIDALRAGLNVEVEATAPTNLTQREHFSGIEIEVTFGSGGEQFVKVWLAPEASGDLRAAQRAHNDRILNWIESLNEPCADEDDAAEEEDAAYGDEPRNEAIP